MSQFHRRVLSTLVLALLVAGTCLLIGLFLLPMAVLAMISLPYLVLLRALTVLQQKFRQLRSTAREE
jgi:hypothetical protein